MPAPPPCFGGGAAVLRRERSDPYRAAGLYHLSSPFWVCLPASSGVIVPFITPAVMRHSSFSRFGSPRERIWYELRMVDLAMPRQLRNVCASGSCRSIFWFDRLKKPGSALLYNVANSGVVIH